MHIVAYLCCDLSELLGGHLPVFCFQGKKTRTLSGDKVTSTTTFFFSESVTAPGLHEVEHR